MDLKDITLPLLLSFAVCHLQSMSTVQKHEKLIKLTLNCMEVESYIAVF